MTGRHSEQPQSDKPPEASFDIFKRINIFSNNKIEELPVISLTEEATGELAAKWFDINNNHQTPSYLQCYYPQVILWVTLKLAMMNRQTRSLSISHIKHESEHL